MWRSLFFLFKNRYKHCFQTDEEYASSVGETAISRIKNFRIILAKQAGFPPEYIHSNQTLELYFGGDIGMRLSSAIMDMEDAFHFHHKEIEISLQMTTGEMYRKIRSTSSDNSPPSPPTHE